MTHEQRVRYDAASDIMAAVDCIDSVIVQSKSMATCAESRWLVCKAAKAAAVLRLRLAELLLTEQP